MSRRCLILGAGGHGRVLADALLAAGETVAGFLDTDQERWGETIYGLPILGSDELLQQDAWADVDLVNGVGGTGTSLGVRAGIQLSIEGRGGRFRGVIHPSAIVSSNATLAPDAQVLAGAVIQPGAVIDEGCIINTRSVVEHDCRLGAFVHCAPGAVICGDVTVGSESHIGAGAVVKQGLTLGQRLVVGAGAVVVRDHAGPGVLTGVPAAART